MEPESWLHKTPHANDRPLGLARCTYRGARSWNCLRDKRSLPPSHRDRTNHAGHLQPWREPGGGLLSLHLVGRLGPRKVGKVRTTYLHTSVPPYVTYLRTSVPPYVTYLRNVPYDQRAGSPSIHLVPAARLSPRCFRLRSLSQPRLGYGLCFYWCPLADRGGRARDGRVSSLSTTWSRSRLGSQFSGHDSSHLF